MNIVEHAELLLTHLWGEVDEVILTMFLFLTTAPIEKRIEVFQPLFEAPLIEVSLKDILSEEPNRLIISIKTENGEGVMVFCATKEEDVKPSQLLN